MDVTVIVPIHDALNDVTRCLASLRENTPERHRLLLIDDASTDRRIVPLLRSYTQKNAPAEFVRHERNLGYTATVNHGCRLAGRDDVVLLNSDTQVTPGWLGRLAATAYRTDRGRIATVTPLSNAAGPFSVPRRSRNAPSPSGLAPSEMATLVERLSERSFPRVPTGHGFCLYVRREAIAAVGPFDERAFPRGYGEENDFCLRATALGFVHVIDDTSYVHHRGGASFGWRKRLLLATSAWKLRLRYPDYRRQVAAWMADDPLEPLRQRLQEHLATRAPSSE